MNNTDITSWLNDAWERAINVADANPDPIVDEIVNSRVQSIRYAVITQILGRIANPKRSVMMLQRGGSEEGAWDARSFATAVIVPWERQNHQVIGGSPDPYVSNPLRRPRLDDYTGVRYPEEWKRLVAFLRPLDEVSPAELEKTCHRVLCALARRLRRQSFSYPIPQRISQPRLENLVESFLQESSGGLRALAVATALFKTMGEGFKLFADVTSQGINEADAASGIPGDIVCYDTEGEICLAVEVKDAHLTLNHVEQTNLKAKTSDSRLSNVLFATSGVREGDAVGIKTLTDRSWAEGLNLYAVTISELVRVVLVLLEESWRVRFLREIGNELDERQDQVARKAWSRLLGRGEP